MSFEDLFKMHAEWSNAQFGDESERGPQGPIAHLAREVKELAASPDDPSEYADCLFLVMDAARRSGLSLEALLQACFHKLEINKQRAWARPNEDGSVEHVRD